MYDVIITKEHSDEFYLNVSHKIKDSNLKRLVVSINPASDHFILFTILRDE